MKISNGAMFNFRLVELARNARGLTQKGLVQLLNKLNQPTLSKLERGDISVVTSEIAQELAQALSFPVGFFYQEQGVAQIRNFYFRKRSSLPVKTFDKIFSEIQLVLMGIDGILEEVYFPEYPKYKFDLSESWTTDAVAQRMREILEIEYNRPVRNLVSRLERIGIVVYLYDSPSEYFDGMTVYSNKGVPVIFANKNMPNDRLIFTIAHELFHLVMHIPCSIEPNRDEEQEANSAASEFLLPASGCLKDLMTISYHKLTILKANWGVSKAAILRRAKDLNVITPETYKYLIIELGRKGERKYESGYVELDKPSLISKSVNLLKSELGYGSLELADKLNFQETDFNRLFHIDNYGDVRLKLVRD